MKTLAIVPVIAALVVGLSAQGEPPRPARTVSDFFRDFTAEWMRANPNQAAASRYFTGTPSRMNL
jgi:hypothetical protein